jgi:hypothetical protein
VTMTLMFSSPLLQQTGARCQDVIGRAVPGACTKSESDPNMRHSDFRVIRSRKGIYCYGLLFKRGIGPNVMLQPSARHVYDACVAYKPCAAHKNELTAAVKAGDFQR